MNAGRLVEAGTHDELFALAGGLYRQLWDMQTGTAPCDADAGCRGELMEIAIAGMHRSGTSMVASLLRQAGLCLGRDEEMLPPAADNPGGFWEHAEFVALNDEVLRTARGAAWDSPPDQTTLDKTHVGSCSRALAALIARFDGHEHWGWKDPRTSLTFPFWQPLLPHIRVVIVLRNPLEVGHSLAARNRVSVAFGLRLWRRSHEHLLTSAKSNTRIVTHLDSWYEDDAEIDRVATFCALSIDAGQRGRLRPDSALRHQRCTLDALHDEADTETFEIYHALCAEAEGAAPARAARPAGFDALVAAIDNIAARQVEQEERLVSVLRHFDPEPPPPDENVAAQAAAAAEDRRARIAHLEDLHAVVAAEAGDARQPATTSTSAALPAASILLPRPQRQRKGLRGARSVHDGPLPPRLPAQRRSRRAVGAPDQMAQDGNQPLLLLDLTRGNVVDRGDEGIETGRPSGTCPRSTSASAQTRGRSRTSRCRLRRAMRRACSAGGAKRSRAGAALAVPHRSTKRRTRRCGDLGIVFVPGVEMCDDTRVGLRRSEQVFVVAAPEPQSECHRHTIPSSKRVAYFQWVAEDDDYSDVRQERAARTEE